MIRLWRWVRSRLTMRRYDRAFIDKVSGLPIYYWRDCYGYWWLAEFKYGMRMPAASWPPIPEAKAPQGYTHD